MIRNVRNRKVILSIGMFLCTCACTFLACKSADSEENDIELVRKEDEIAYALTGAEYGDVVKDVKISCTYMPTKHQDLAFMIDDKLIERVNVKEGDIVTAGDLLASADVGDLEDTIWEIEYTIEHQSLELKHINETKAFDITSAKNMYSYTYMTDEDKRNLQEALDDIDKRYHDSIQDLEDSIALNQKRLDKYRKELDGGQIIAGISGMVTYMRKPLADTYSEKETKVMTISDLDSSYFVADDVTYADAFKEGETYKVVYKKNNTETYVEVTPAEMDNWQEHMYLKPVNNEIIENMLTGTIYIELDRKSNVLCVQNDAIHEAEDGKFVYVLENEMLSMRYVEVGLEGLSTTEILSGLKQGETIVLK